MTVPAVTEEIADFVGRCVPLTGFAVFDLYATGMAERYLETARQQVGAAAFAEFWAAWTRALDGRGGPQDLSPVHLEVARALAYLWLTGSWPRLAPEAHAALRRQMANEEFVVAPEAYVEGLVWRTFHGHPAGAKPPGFGTWAVPPPAQPAGDGLRQELGLDEELVCRTGLESEVAVHAVPDHLLPGYRAWRQIPPSAVPTSSGPATKEEHA
ncbi:hypothetical protein RMN57_01530 [Kitasatospora sp. CM 4170]|uniref:Uncharacterized protein n=1 Tax=Kitasatospora aburaviensis TaxID=67265 RepID=A0ABW1FCN5_9ACTN|nr:hypothetical protein [Kitasatospora sp. CM 4170]WNM43473.1 hypothetical protein RMN57_01530 [Kitasatospora sp. CM 4170]